ncbi:hypothetical protein BDZ91DRAFT_768329 [Kalaharituber pfeilii]|nr:hypothetical protein BDZ91DRAFT_768329 [Kalaharituber pfeilii]
MKIEFARALPLRTAVCGLLNAVTYGSSFCLVCIILLPALQASSFAASRAGVMGRSVNGQGVMSDRMGGVRQARGEEPGPTPVPHAVAFPYNPPVTTELPTTLFSILSGINLSL